MIWILFLLLFSFSTADVANNHNNELVILFLSQPHIYTLSQIHNASSLIPPHIPILYTHSFGPSISNWYAIYPVFAPILIQYPPLKWLFICEPQTRVNLTGLLQFARKTTTESPNLFVGHGLYDSEPSIIHHYSFSSNDPYPDLSAGVLISRNVLSNLVDRLESYKKRIDFIIDVKFELNQVINELTQTRFIDRSDLFCNQQKQQCPSTTAVLTWSDAWQGYSCQRSDIQLEHLYFGIKTFVDYHQTRVRRLRKTWLIDELNYHLFTNQIQDLDFTNRIILQKENTQRGHCHKTFAILNYFNQHQHSSKFLIIADDDTLLSVARLLQLIRCFMLTDDIPIVLGERYGYGAHYDYPTGGSGIVLNRQAVKQLLANCQCPSSDTPDDMFLGMCLKRINIPLIHIPEFHQAQPNAYSNDWLRQQQPISFHKFDNIDVEQVYRTYLYEEYQVEERQKWLKDEF